MKNCKLLKLFVIVFAVFAALTSVRAQEETPAPDAPPRNDARRSEKRPNLLRELGLTVEQMRQIRQFNENRRPVMQQAQQKVRDAMRSLDQAIYADVVNENEFQTRLKTLQEAQAEIARLRAANELEVRKILTADQLVKFRELRRRFADMRENSESQRRAAPPQNNGKNRPERRFNRQLRKVPPS